MSFFTEVIIYQHLQQISHLYLVFVRLQTFILFHFGLNGTKIYKIEKKRKLNPPPTNFHPKKSIHAFMISFSKKVNKNKLKV